MTDAHDTAKPQTAQGWTPGPWVVNFRADGSSYISMGGIKPGQAHKQFDLLLSEGETT